MAEDASAFDLVEGVEIHFHAPFVGQVLIRGQLCQLCLVEQLVEYQVIQFLRFSVIIVEAVQGMEPAAERRVQVQLHMVDFRQFHVDEGEFVVHYVKPRGEYKDIMTEMPDLPQNIMLEDGTFQFVFPTVTPEAPTESVTQAPTQAPSEYRDEDRNEEQKQEESKPTEAPKPTEEPAPTEAPEPTHAPEPEEPSEPSEPPADEPSEPEHPSEEEGNSEGSE